ncbi:hypothetical protein CERZMDRAFT_88803 [Cercospora zeae-maydis SCOH1-5]|uniref:Uncharacterized protein n=1 Tax=Cercospora zeae-maydis SCOH1-5 TaxID=717836 RepID=A0A6A6EZZ7_9PEZI|nr:hypothetical protein CERZMDRAFT_88803 [Cercospora zeae-maydis SCOH1-5]
MCFRKCRRRVCRRSCLDSPFRSCGESSHCLLYCNQYLNTIAADTPRLRERFTPEIIHQIHDLPPGALELPLDDPGAYCLVFVVAWVVVHARCSHSPSCSKKISRPSQGGNHCTLAAMCEILLHVSAGPARRSEVWESGGFSANKGGPDTEDKTLLALFDYPAV